jgi:hypothetical protein
LVGLSHTIVGYYDEPSSLILTLRLLSSLSGAIAALLAFEIVQKLSKDTIVAIAAALIVTFLPLSLQQSLIGTNDAVALMFAMAAAYGLVTSPVKPVLVGLASAATLATKVALAIWLAPVVLGGAIYLYQREGGRAVFIQGARCLGAGIAGVVLFYPYLWLQPVRAIKAVAGNVLAHTNNYLPNLSLFSITIPGAAVMICLIAASIFAIAAAWQNERWRSAALAAGLLLAGMFAFFLHSGFDYWRYMLGALVPGAVLFGVIFAAGRRIPVASILAAIVLGFGAGELLGQVQIRHARLPALATEVAAMCRRGETIWMFDQVLAARYRRLPMPKAALAEVASYFASADKTPALRDWLTAAKVNPAAADALQTDFDEEEQVHLARWRAMALIGVPSLDCPFHFFRSASGETALNALSGYVRGTFTDKSLRDVRVALKRPSGEVISGEVIGGEVINVIGPAEVLARLNLPMRAGGDGMSVITQRAN